MLPSTTEPIAAYCCCCCCCCCRPTQLEDLQSTYEAELQRRAESEAAARNAAQVCRGQLEVLREQVEMLQVKQEFVLMPAASLHEFVCLCQGAQCENTCRCAHARVCARWGVVGTGKRTWIESRRITLLSVSN